MRQRTYCNAYVVLLTATIDPGLYGKDLARNNAQLRIEDYQHSLKFWMGISDPRIRGIVFCENSGADLNAFKERARNSTIPIEFLSFDGNSKPAGVHYGWSELGIIDHAIQESSLIAECQYFIKATGRLRFPRISKLLDSTNTDFDAIVDHRKKYKGESGCHTRARTQLMLFSKAFYEGHFLDARDEMLGKCSHIEEFIAAKLISLQEGPKIIRRFPVECPPVGITGWKGDSYQSKSNRAKNAARSLMRKLVPWVWV